ncbi:hypothetical protein [Prolixibacter sp. SD074]|jgi:hypothetical protein|uniref:hypothetical protein n=1 Tax=Prolixibacter sp. SD074 TaxID=2652391 RepID=UPI00126B1087|nr:hypothetical protein [Prolixibacter sp. SD074]GET28658.1 hypothetical protein SD074_08600 [Prolixibacter sp. SD074]
MKVKLYRKSTGGYQCRIRKTKGYYEDVHGNKIYRKDFKGVYVAGSAYPLNRDFEDLPNNKQLELTGPDSNGIYSVQLMFNAFNRALTGDAGTGSGQNQPGEEGERWSHYSGYGNRRRLAGLLRPCVAWSLAAWEIYKTTGDKNWLKLSYEIVRNTNINGEVNRFLLDGIQMNRTCG